MPDQPNILFILTDTQRFDTLACYGNSLIQTPNPERSRRSEFRIRERLCSLALSAPRRARRS